MLLRTRISLFATAAFVVICVCLAVAALQREEIINARFAGEIINDRSTVWKRVIDKIALRMEARVEVVANSSDLVAAIDREDYNAIRQYGGRLHQQLASAGVSDRLDIVSASGSVLYSSLPNEFPTPAISPELVAQAMADQEVISGLGNDRQRHILVAVGLPLLAGRGVVGLAVLGTEISEAIAEMEIVTRSTVFFVNRRGRLLAGTAEDLWRELDDQIDLVDVNSLQTLELSDRVYSAIVLPQEVELGSLQAIVVSVRDITDVASQQQRLRNLMIVGTAVGLAIMVVLLNFYMAWAFAPLAVGINMLNALSRGNLSIRMDTGDVRDEVGRISNALNLFRSKLVAMDRLRQSRERQRGRQERFIRREMTELADTLDEEERAAVLEELQQVEDQVRERASESENTFVREAKSLEHFDRADEPDEEESGGGTSSAEREGLAMMALAFQKMSERVQNQNQRLRDSLAIKNALIAIQKELDIAAKVQLSLMPTKLPESPAFSVHGTMKPAKEVGGDFFDYFRIDEHHIAIVIADVSGKGVPAALFMVMARTVLRATIRMEETPGEVLDRVNSFLDRNNAEQLFVTVFFGVLNESTGRFSFANGGHNSPLLVSDGSATPLKLTGGVVLGMIEGLVYEDTYIDLVPGDRIIFVTDGIAEATDSELNDYGDDRLIKAASSLPEQSPEEDVSEIVRGVEEFVGDAPQFDDITCVALHFRGSSGDGDPDGADRSVPDRDS